MPIQNYLLALLFFPLLGYVVNVCIPEKKEKLLSWLAFSFVGIHFLLIQIFLVYWWLHGHPDINVKEFDLYRSGDYDFFIDLYFDEISAVYLFVGASLTYLVSVYSRLYLHKEDGYKRFYNTVLLFYFGYIVVIVSGNFETMFIGWELVGVSSFLLIAFYRDRYLPVKNAFKTYSVYRIGDAGLLLTMWISHHLWHENVTFVKLDNSFLVHSHIESHSIVGVAMSLMIVLAAVVKSAQAPLSSWLPRAMEGPTPSSAIFYGSLSVHLGAFLLLRTQPFWEQQISVKVLIILIGMVTAATANGIARVQSTVKSQIAYSSISQIGLIFIEIALGWELLALIHFAGNAFLRTYQLLVSPSIVSHLIREQFYNYTPREETIEDALPKRLEYTLYWFCMKEAYMDSFMYRVLWMPLKKLGNFLGFLSAEKWMFWSSVILFLWFLSASFVPSYLGNILSVLLPFCGFLLACRTLTERKNTISGWVLVAISHIYVVLGIRFNETVSVQECFVYLSGVFFSGILGYLILKLLIKKEPTLSLQNYQGHSFEYRKMGLFFLIACLGLAAFPITPTFIGVDLLFTHVQEHQILLTVILSLHYFVCGLALIRMYARIFMGPHIKNYHPIAYRSS